MTEPNQMDPSLRSTEAFQAGFQEGLREAHAICVVAEAAAQQERSRASNGWFKKLSPEHYIALGKSRAAATIGKAICALGT
jgi:hypothetical protein